MLSATLFTPYINPRASLPRWVANLGIIFVSRIRVHTLGNRLSYTFRDLLVRGSWVRVLELIDFI